MLGFLRDFLHVGHFLRETSWCKTGPEALSDISVSIRYISHFSMNVEIKLTQVSKGRRDRWIMGEK